jgi:hypothetical protein
MRDDVSFQDKTTGELTVLHVVMFAVLKADRKTTDSELNAGEHHEMRM